MGGLAKESRLWRSGSRFAPGWWDGELFFEGGVDEFEDFGTPLFGAEAPAGEGTVAVLIAVAECGIDRAVASGAFGL